MAREVTKRVRMPASHENSHQPYRDRQLRQHLEAARAPDNNRATPMDDNTCQLCVCRQTQPLPKSPAYPAPPKGGRSYI